MADGNRHNDHNLSTCKHDLTIIEDTTIIDDTDIPEVDSSKIKFVGLNDKIGPSSPIYGSLSCTLFHPKHRGHRCVQFTMSNFKGHTHKFNRMDLKLAKALCECYGKTFYVHTAVNLNLAKHPTDNKVSWYKRTLKQELDQISDLPGGCVLHIGKGKGGGTLQNLIYNINSLSIERNNVVPSLILENAAGQGTELGVTLEEIRYIYENLDSNVIGLCIDTQHSFASGICDFRDSNIINNFMDDIEGITGKPLDLIHLNDSKKEFGSRVDRHENIGYGHIWGKDTSGLQTLVDRCKDQGIPMITETPEPLRDANVVLTNFF